MTTPKWTAGVGYEGPPSKWDRPLCDDCKAERWDSVYDRTWPVETCRRSRKWHRRKQAATSERGN
jgi:hypothetical protein